MKVSVKGKLALVVGPLLVALVTYAALRVVEASRIKTAAANVYALVDLSAVNSRLVHELQKERGLSAGFLASEGGKFTDKLLEQRQLTDQRLDELQRYLERLGADLGHFTGVADTMRRAQSGFSRLETIRQQVSALDIPQPQAIAYYTGLNGMLLSVPDLAMQESTESEITVALAAYGQFLQGKERAGIERAVLSSTFAQGAFAPGLFERFITLLSEQRTYFGSFQAYARPAEVSVYRQFLQDPASLRVEAYREQARGGALNQDADAWFSASTDRINQLKQLENLLGDNILQLAQHTMAARSTAFWIYLLVSLAVVLSSLLVSYRIVRQFDRQIANLAAVMGRVADKDLRPRADILSGDELGDIATRLNGMLGEMTQAMNRILGSSDQLAAAAEQSTTAASQGAVNLEHQQAEVLQVASAIEEMTASVHEVAQNIQLTSDAATEADQQVANSNQLVNESTENIHQVAQQIDLAAATVNQLHESSAAISGVVEVIKSIAEQTNLLALNAAIEAARAGEQGRGFAVVADEVRSLAQRTQDSTLEIEGMIDRFKADSDQVFTQMEGSRAMVASSVEKASAVRAALDDVVAAIGSIRQMAMQIASAAEEQVAVSHEIAVKAQNISDEAQATSTSSQQIAQASQGQAQLAVQLRDLANEFRMA